VADTKAYLQAPEPSMGQFRWRLTKPRATAMRYGAPAYVAAAVNQAELEAFAAAKVSRAMRLAVIAAARAGLAVLAAASTPSYKTMSASANASESATPVPPARCRKD
jgi:hypothetical protein